MAVLPRADRVPTALRPPIDIEGPQDYLTEIHARAKASSACRPTGWSGVRPLLDYGFGEDEHYHPSATWAR